MKKLLLATLAFVVAGHLHAATVNFSDVMNFQNGGNLWQGKEITSQTFTYTHDLNDDVDFSTHEVTQANLRLTVWDGLLPIDGKGKFLWMQFDNNEYLSYAFDGEDWVEVNDEVDHETFVLGVNASLLNVDGKLAVSLQAWNSLDSADFFLKESELWGEAEMKEVPEPATLALFGAGLLGLGVARRRNNA